MRQPSHAWYSRETQYQGLQETLAPQVQRYSRQQGEEANWRPLLMNRWKRRGKGFKTEYFWTFPKGKNIVLYLTTWGDTEGIRASEISQIQEVKCSQFTRLTGGERQALDASGSRELFLEGIVWAVKDECVLAGFRAAQSLELTTLFVHLKIYQSSTSWEVFLQ